jgi:C-terminal processing protease CtpA/Prc
LQVFLFIFTKVRYRTCITIPKAQNIKHTMKLLLTVCFTGFLPVLALAQTAPADANAKPAPFEPLVAKEHMGLGRIGVRLAFDKDTGLPHITYLTRGGPAADYGLRAGDVIIRIDKNYTTTLTQEEVSLALHGEPGTGVELTIQRDDDPHYIIRAVERRILRADQEDIAQPPRSEVGEATAPY